MHPVASVRAAEVSGKRVLLRTSLNVPLTENGSVADASRLKAALPTIEYLCEHEAKVVVIGHLGRKGDSLKRVAEALAALAKPKVSFFGGSLEEAKRAIEALPAGECLVLENVRRFPGETKNDPALAQELAALGDLFVNDAFADSHREHASIVGVAKLLPSFAGLLMKEEMEKLSEALMPAKKAIAIIGGAKFETKEPLIQRLISLYEKVLLGGALANDVLKARGAPVGASLVSEEGVPVELAEDTKLAVPIDAVITEKGFHTERQSFVNDVRATELIADVGPRTVEAWSKDIAEADFVLWNGPMGIYEEGYTGGTDALAQALASSKARAAIGGGDTVAALAQFSFDPKRIFVSTGGGAMLQYLVTGTLPGIDALRK